MKIYSIILFLILPWLGLASAHAEKVKSCEELKNLSRAKIAAGGGSREAFLDCYEKGEDPPLLFRNSLGELPVTTPVGNEYKLGPCRPTMEKQCPNNMREYTDGGDASTGILTDTDLKSDKEPTPFGKLKDNYVPCGALASFAQRALRGLLSKGNNVSVNTPVVGGAANNLLNDMSNQINGALTGLVGNFFKYKNCQGGQFWGILNHIFTVVMGQGKYRYDHTNNTFSSRKPVYVTMPVGTTISMQLGGGKINPITLPNGGSLSNAKGGKVNFGEFTTVSFRTDGIVSTSNGNKFRVNPKETLTLNPNEIIEIPAGTPIPVDPKQKLYPAAPATEKPDWFDGYVAGAR